MRLPARDQDRRPAACKGHRLRWLPGTVQPAPSPIWALPVVLPLDDQHVTLQVLYVSTETDGTPRGLALGFGFDDWGLA